MAGGTTPTEIEVGDAVAMIQLDGVISSGSGDYFAAGGITPDLVDGLLEQAAINPDVKAVVVRVNSPGGSAVASDEIYHAFLEFDKPIVVWMGDTAASGGYYIACGSDYVFAHPATLTGSIGVISQFINAEELLDKVGVNVVVIASGPRKDLGSSFREMTEEEQALWQEITSEVYEDFVALVAEARGMSLDEVRELADGSVYTGRQALEHGLVDGVGTPDDAIAKAAELGGIVGQPRVIELESTPSFLESLYGFQARSGMPTLEEVLGWAGAPTLEFRFVGP
jgi:protease-4